MALVDLLELVDRARGKALALRLLMKAIAARAAVIELGHTRSGESSPRRWQKPRVHPGDPRARARATRIRPWREATVRTRSGRRPAKQVRPNRTTVRNAAQALHVRHAARAGRCHRRCDP